MTQVTYAATAGQTAFAITFDYISTAHLMVSIDGVVEADWTLTSPTTITLGMSVPPLTEGQSVVIQRVTPTTGLLSEFSGASQIRAQEINRVLKQLLFISQEGQTSVQSALRKNILGTVWDAEGLRITDVAAAVNPDDAVTLATVQNLLATGGTLPLPVTGDITKYVRVVDSGGGPVYALQPGYGARVHLEIPLQVSGVLGYNAGYLVEPQNLNPTDWNLYPDTRVPLEVKFAVGFPVGGTLSMDPNTYDILLPAGTWEYEIVGTVRSRTNQGNANQNGCVAAITNSTGSTVYKHHYGVSLGFSGGHPTHPFGASATIAMRGFIGVGVTTRINLRLAAFTSADDVIADVPFSVRLEEIIR